MREAQANWVLAQAKLQRYSATIRRRKPSTTRRARPRPTGRATHRDGMRQRRARQGGLESAAWSARTGRKAQEYATSHPARACGRPVPDRLRRTRIWQHFGTDRNPVRRCNRCVGLDVRFSHDAGQARRFGLQIRGLVHGASALARPRTIAGQASAFGGRSVTDPALPLRPGIRPPVASRFTSLLRPKTARLFTSRPRPRAVPEARRQPGWDLFT